MSILTRLFLGAYSGLWSAAGPALRRHKRLKPDFDQRLAPDGWLSGMCPEDAACESCADTSPSGQASGAARPLTLWVQAASGGEAWLAHSLVPAIADALDQHPELSARPLTLLCTTWTRQGMDILEKIQPPHCRAAAVLVLPRYFPLDRPALMRRAMGLARPDAVILLETELWPGLMAAATEQDVPVLALNARMTEKSFKAYSKIGFFWRKHAPERILAVSQDDAGRFARLFGRPERVAVMPNIKFDRLVPAEPPSSLQESAPSLQEAHSLRGFRAEAGISGQALLAVLASVREEEEDLLLPVVKSLQGFSISGNPAAVAVAPRHMHRVEAWKTKLQAAGIPYSLRSAHGESGRAEPVAPFCSHPPVYLWDTFGELHSLYSIADAVYVGGSLVPLGGQNFLEPLALGVIPFVGPHIDNFLWVGKELFDQGLAVMLPDATALLAAFESELSLRRDAFVSGGHDAGPDWRAGRSREAGKVMDRFASWLRPRLGGSGQAAEALARVLAKEGKQRKQRFPKEIP